MDSGNFNSYALLDRLFPICRSLTGDGVRSSLRILKEYLPALEIHEVESGTKCFDWEVPDEWNIRSARLTGPRGKVIADMDWSNLHVVGYSEPVQLHLSLEELQPHLHSLPDQPDAIPYVTSYYKRNWGFCLEHRKRQSLESGTYKVEIDSTLRKGSLTYADLLVPGRSSQEILVSTYICHPSMANNELSGPVIATRLARVLAQFAPRYTYRFVFVPETIGCLVYLSEHLEHLKNKVKAGFVLSCLGDENGYSWVSSRLEDTLADRVVAHVMAHSYPLHKKYSWLERGSDERNYCWPGVDLPVVALSRSKYGCFPEYHTSLDNLSFVTEEGLEGGYQLVKKVVDSLEMNDVFVASTVGEPQMGKRGLYAPDGAKASVRKGLGNAREMIDILGYSDGEHDLIDIAEKLGKSVWEIRDSIEPLEDCELLTRLR